MQTYLIEPKAPLVVRSGRPFDEQNGTDDAQFPPPSTLAGALRTAHAERAGLAFNDELASLPVQGGLPVRIDAHGKTTLLVPKPADALYFWDEHKTNSRLVRSAPQALAQGEGCDLPLDLLPVQLTETVKGKSAPGARWWAWDDLITFRQTGALPHTVAQLGERGWLTFADEVRTHVGIDSATHAAETGKLFQTAGLNYWQKPTTAQPLPQSSIGILGRIKGNIDAGIITLGGERRLSAISPASESLWHKCPENLPAEIRQAGGLSLTLLTPALFQAGWYPHLLSHAGLRLKLRAAAVNRWQPHSGWDLAKNQPRAGRKLVPAGSVFWFQLLDATDAALIELWLGQISDDKQDRLDGFGLALPQAWQAS